MTTAAFKTWRRVATATCLCLAVALGLSRAPTAAADDAEQVPPRPSADAAQAPARRLFEAIQTKNPALAADFFFPKDAFREVKAISNPDRYWEKLFARYEADIRALHTAHPELKDAAFERLEVVRRGGWVRVGEEGNRLPYWAARHNRLHYRVGEKRAFLEVRVLITWKDAWFITHLSEFH